MCLVVLQKSASFILVMTQLHITQGSPNLATAVAAYTSPYVTSLCRAVFTMTASTVLWRAGATERTPNPPAPPSPPPLPPPPPSLGTG